MLYSYKILYLGNKNALSPPGGPSGGQQAHRKPLKNMVYLREKTNNKSTLKKSDF